MISNTPPKDFVQVPDPAGPGNSRYLGPAAGPVTSSWEDGATTVHVDVDEDLTVEQARQLLADLGEVLAKLEAAE